MDKGKQNTQTEDCCSLVLYHFPYVLVWALIAFIELMTFEINTKLTAHPSLLSILLLLHVSGNILFN